MADGRCIVCNQTVFQRFVRHELTVLVVLCGVALLAFAVTRAAAAAMEQQRLDDAEEWFRRGNGHLQSGEIADAVTALRRAAGMDRDRKDYNLTLARALAADGQVEAALQVLLARREITPEDPDVNLALARLQVEREDIFAAVAHYQRALYGAWDTARLVDRGAVRIELVRYLLQHGMRDRALSELLVLVADLPDAPEQQTAAAELLLQAGEARRALALFTRALRLQPESVTAIAGAARAALALHDFTGARRLLSDVDAQESVEVGRLRRIVDLVIANDPLQAAIPAAERRRRTLRGLEWAADFVRMCAAKATSGSAGPLLSEAAALRASAETTRAREMAALSESVVGLIERIGTNLAAVCPPVEPADRAWLLISERHATPPA